MQTYIEPFAGSLAVLLGRPEDHERPIETVNDRDGFLANVWRAIAAAPETVAEHADWPVNENDLHARHAWLVEQRADLTARLEGDPDYYDAKIAGWWLWGVACWIGGGWCSGAGPWVRRDGKLVHLGDAGQGVQRQLVHLGNAGQGVNRQLVHLSNAGRGDPGTGVQGLVAWMRALAERLARVRVACGDWTRVCTPAVTRSVCGIVLDPPYSAGERDADIYSCDSGTVAADVRRWAIDHGDDPRMRIVLCGYDGEHALPESWSCVAWKAHGGYGRQGEGRGRDNAHRERLWFSPHCLAVQAPAVQLSLAGAE